MAPFLKWFFVLVVSLSIFLPDLFSNQKLTSKQDHHILSLSPAETQNLFYLGVGDKIVAVSPYDMHPNVQSLPKLAGINASDEDILRLNPSLIVVSETEAFSHFRDKGVKVHVSKTEGLQAVYSNLLALENILNLSSEGSTKYLNQLKNVPKISPKGSFLFIIAIDPVYAVSERTVLSELLNLSGWSNVVKTKIAYPILSEEEILKLKVDIILVPEYLSKEMPSLQKIASKIGASSIKTISEELLLPSPYLLEKIPFFSFN